MVAEMENLVRQYYVRDHFILHIVMNICAVSSKILKKCRRQVIIDYFKEKPNAPDTTHDCCDACRESCDCETCSSEQLSPDEEVSEPLPTLSRTAEEEARQLLRELLKEI